MAICGFIIKAFFDTQNLTDIFGYQLCEVNFLFFFVCLNV